VIFVALCSWRRSKAFPQTQSTQFALFFVPKIFISNFISSYFKFRALLEENKGRFVIYEEFRAIWYIWLQFSVTIWIAGERTTAPESACSPEKKVFPVLFFFIFFCFQFKFKPSDWSNGPDLSWFFFKYYPSDQSDDPDIRLLLCTLFSYCIGLFLFDCEFLFDFVDGPWAWTRLTVICTRFLIRFNICTPCCNLILICF